MEIGDLAADRKPESGSGGLCCEKRLEDLRSNGRIDSGALIEDSNDDRIRPSTPRRMFRFDSDRSAVGHGFDRVPEKIYKELNELARITEDPR